jgi:ATP-dependent helicase HrpA
LPLDPRVGRMLIAARAEGCLDEVLVIAAALSVQDPRERPLDRQAAADQRHAKFADERSDFLAFLKLWKLQGEQGLRRLCRDNFLSYPRMREWRDVHAQLETVVGELDWKRASAKPEKPEGYRAIHRALLAGLLGNLGMKDDAEGAYTGARGIKFRVHPGSGTKKPGKWIVAAELVETTRLYARTVATIDAQWLEELGAHLLKRHRDNPHWEKNRAQVVALERGTLYGLPVYTQRRVHYGPHDPALARDLFIRSALVEGEFDTRAPFFAHNRRLVHEIERMEHKQRRPDILVDDELIRAFYDARIPEGIHNGADFEKWRKDAEAANPKLLHLKREDLMRHEAAGITTENFPHELVLGANAFALDYHFDPRSPRDGVTLTVPVALLNQVPQARCEWLVPGLLKEKVRALAKSMPQRLRHRLGPLDEFAEDFAAKVPPSDTPLAQALARHIRAELNLDVPTDAFRPDSAPPHLHMNFRVIDEDGRQLGMGRNLAALKRELGRETERPAAARGARGEIHRLDHGRPRRGDGDRARRPDARRLPRAGRCGRRRHAAGVRHAGEGGGAPPRGRAAAPRPRLQGAHPRPGARLVEGHRARAAEGRPRRRVAGPGIPRRVGADARRPSSRARWRPVAAASCSSRRKSRARRRPSSRAQADLQKRIAHGGEGPSAGRRGHAAAARAAARARMAEAHALGAAAALPALPEGGGGAAGEAARRPGARRAPDGRARAAARPRGCARRGRSTPSASSSAGCWRN